jgi:adenylate cyclase
MATTILRYGFLSVLIMLILSLIAPSQIPFVVSLAFAFLFGVVLGLYHEFFGFGFASRWPFIPRLIAGLLVIQVLVMVTLVLNRLTLKGLSLNLTDAPLAEVLFQASSLNFYYKAWIFGLLVLFLIELEKTLGPRYLFDMALGRYRKPVRENRVILFVDLVDSTSLAEKLGDERYYAFINDCFRLLHGPVVRHRGEVLKYIGDEVIVSWNDESLHHTDEFLSFYLDFLKSLAERRDYFEDTYGTYPRFRAGAHRDSVVVAYIGDIKRQKDLNGDAMNTASRITGLTKKFEADLLISTELYRRLGKEGESFEGPISERVEGKSQPLELYRWINKKPRA